MSFAPIVLFVYNRPVHTERTLEALLNNDLASESELYIYADGPKPNATLEQQEKIAEVRNVIRKRQWCGNVHIVESDTNKGLADSIISGVTEIVNKYGKVIVLEDDICTSVGFLRFMNEALTMYEYEEKVMQVSGYIYPHKYKTKDTTCFLRIMSCWGWGTWKRAWKYYEHNIDVHLSHYSTSREIKKFNIEGHGKFYWQLIANKNNEIYTWAVRWYASWLYQGGYTLFPMKSLVQNNGFDDTGENTTKKDLKRFTGEIAPFVELKRQSIKENHYVRCAIDSFYKDAYKISLARKIKNHLNKIGNVSLMWNMFQFFRLLYRGDINLNAVCDKKSNVSFGKYSQIKSLYHIYDSSIGDYSYVASNSYIYNTSIGRFCSIGSNFRCGIGIHPTSGVSTSPMFYSSMRQNGISLSGKNKIEEHLPVKIGNDVFIGDNVIVCSGITIGDGAIIGAGAVVSKDIPPYAIAVGCPIQIKKYRFDKRQIEDLLEIRWWDWNDHDLYKVEKCFFDIDNFINVCKNDKESSI